MQYLVHCCTDRSKSYLHGYFNEIMHYCVLMN